MSGEGSVSGMGEWCNECLCHTVGMDVNDRLAPKEFWSFVQNSADQVRRSFAELPLFAPTQWPGPVMVGEWSFDRGLRGLMHGLPGRGMPYINVMASVRDVHHSARTLWRRNRGPRPRYRVDRYRSMDNFDAESPQQRLMLVDGSWRDFDVWEEDNHWWAVAEGSECRILLEAENINPSKMALVTVDDIEPYIAGRNQWIREQRGET